MSQREQAARSVDLFLLTRVQNFIEKQFSRQPAWLRALVYFMFVSIFLYGSFRLIGGDYAVSGYMMARKDGVLVPVRDFDIAIRGDEARFGTNAFGKYYVVLKPARYFALLTTGTLTVDLVRPDGRQMQESRRLEMDRFTQSFTHLLVDSPTENRPIPLTAFDIGGPLYAAELPNYDDRLFIKTISLPASDSRATSVDLELVPCNTGIRCDGARL